MTKETALLAKLMDHCSIGEYEMILEWYRAYKDEGQGALVEGPQPNPDRWARGNRG